jgi:hypothetical protein
MDYQTLRERPRQFLTLTSLRPAEFDDLLADFAPAWERYHRYHTLEGRKRAFPAHRERATVVLAGSDTKLFFLLNYLRGLGSKIQKMGHNSLLNNQITAIIGAAKFRRSNFATCCAYLPWI